MCYTAVCGASCGQKRSPALAGNGFPAWTGSIFRASNCLHCNSEVKIKQVISAPSTAQKLGDCKQKDAVSWAAGRIDSQVVVSRDHLLHRLKETPRRLGKDLIFFPDDIAWCLQGRREGAEAQAGPLCVDQLVKAQGIAQALVYQEGGVEHQVVGRHHIQLDRKSVV